MSLPHADDPAELAAAIAAGDRAAIAHVLNLLDDRRDEARKKTTALLAHLQQDQDNPTGQLIGITGPPGAGKSTLSAALIRVWRARGLRVAVLAVDPSSPISGGALLGDRLRMQTSTEDDGVFVRSLSSRGQFGGLSAEVWPMSVVMLAGFDIVLIETVGVGQREVDIARLCDTTCYVAQPGSGDSVQFIKAGVLEVPHILVVNKADMGNLATRTLSELEAALKRTHPDGHWQVPVLATSAVDGTGIETLADALEEHYQLLRGPQLALRRKRYQAYWIHKRLLEEFGSFGIDQLGGEESLLAQLQAQDMNLFKQYDALRLRLYNRIQDTLE
ncbi:putative GTPase [Halioglobus japonicus]|nr:putative GTPase [Halioglobus japonicus]